MCQRLTNLSENQGNTTVAAHARTQPTQTHPTPQQHPPLVHIHPSPARMRSIFANSHSLLQRGQALRVLSQRWMQSRWNTWPHTPHAILRPGWSGSPALCVCVCVDGSGSGSGGGNVGSIHRQGLRGQGTGERQHKGCWVLVCSCLHSMRPQLSPAAPSHTPFAPRSPPKTPHNPCQCQTRTHTK